MNRYCQVLRSQNYRDYSCDPAISVRFPRMAPSAQFLDAFVVIAQMAALQRGHIKRVLHRARDLYGQRPGHRRPMCHRTYHHVVLSFEGIPAVGSTFPWYPVPSQLHRILHQQQPEKDLWGVASDGIHPNASTCPPVHCSSAGGKMPPVGAAAQRRSLNRKIVKPLLNHSGFHLFLGIEGSQIPAY